MNQDIPLSQPVGTRPTVAIIQARTGSTRLPGKVFARIGEVTVMESVIHHVKAASSVDEIVIATTTNSNDDVIEDIATQLGVGCFRGAENDVLQRFADCVRECRADLVYRVNADNPFISPGFLDDLKALIERSDYEYVSFAVNSVPAMLTPTGLFGELMTRACLERAACEITDLSEREHVTLGIYRSPDRFRVHLLEAPSYISRTPLRLTLDTADDLRLLADIGCSLADIVDSRNTEPFCDAIQRHPAWTTEMARLNGLNKK